MKTCPICNAIAFDDATTCYGCLYRFPENTLPKANAASSDPDNASGAACPQLSPENPPTLPTHNDKAEEQTPQAASTRAHTPFFAQQAPTGNYAQAPLSPWQAASSMQAAPNMQAAPSTQVQIPLPTQQYASSIAGQPLHIDGLPGFCIFIQPLSAGMQQPVAS